MEIFQRRFTLAVCAVAIVCVGPARGYFGGYQLTIGNPVLSRAGMGEERAPYFFATMDAAGYSDVIYYGPSPDHAGAYHELLSGEWGAAVYYDGINTGYTRTQDDDPSRRQAMWLTKEFQYPDWWTYCDFRFGGTSKADHDDNNPAPLNNTGRSIILNNDVEVRIDYEVVDIAPLGGGYSPMAYVIDANDGLWNYAVSDRYVFLQTYTIRNVKAEALTGLELYQFLHSHGADEYGPQVNSTYTDALVGDPLASYVPRNPVHQVGNFRYDITQWNQRPYHTQADHVDYVGFSSAVAPDWVDSSYYEGGHGYYYIPPRGTHHHVEDRMLNEEVEIHKTEVGGAMGWYLGSLDPNETTSLTVAFMFGPEQETGDLVVTVDDGTDGECVSPEDEFTYTITVNNNGEDEAEGVVVTAYLPAGVTYPEGFARFDPNMVVIPPDPAYNAQDHSYTWDIGTIGGQSSASVELAVAVNEQSEPGMSLRLDVDAVSALGERSAQWYTDVCCWGGEIICVDKDATGYGNGVGWEHAYTNPQGALLRAERSCGTEIWVAEGTYDPGRSGSASFEIPANVSVYGGFRGDETLRQQRNPERYKTILTGGAHDERNETVVKMGDDTILDGFTVTEGDLYGVYGKDADLTVENCAIVNNMQNGLYAENGDVIVKWCGITNNGRNGIENVGANAIIENSELVKNKRHGIYSKEGVLAVKNCSVLGNGSEHVSFKGIRLERPVDVPVLYNATIAYNANEGLSWVDNEPNEWERDCPDIQNCIIWYNNGGGDQVAGLNPDATAYYCCIQDCNDVNYNISVEPGFAYQYSTDPNVMLNVHLAYDSPCIDKGSPYLAYNSQTDIDAEDRVVANYVDIGADEVYSCDDDLSADDIYNPVDWTADGIVNMHEFSIFARSWLSVDPNNPICDPNNPNYVSDPNDPAYVSEYDKLRYYPGCDIDDDLDVDISDLALFVPEWLWMACWKEGQLSRFDGMMMAMGGGGNALMIEPATISLTGVETMDAWARPKADDFDTTERLSTIAEILWFIEQVEADYADSTNVAALREYLKEEAKTLVK